MSAVLISWQILTFPNVCYFFFCFSLLLSMWCALSISSAILCHLAVFNVSLTVCLLFYHVFGGQLKLFLVFTWVLGFGFWCGFCSAACFFILARFQSSVKNCSNYLSLSVVCSVFFYTIFGLSYILLQLRFCTE